MDHACEKLWKQGNPLSDTIKDTSTIMRNPTLLFRQTVTHDCASMLDSIARGIPCFHDFSMVHPIPTSPSTQLNDFYTFSYYKCTNCSMVMYYYTASLYAKMDP